MGFCHSSSFSFPSVSCVTRQLRLAFPLDSRRMLLFSIHLPVDSFNGNRTSRRRQSSTLFYYISLLSDTKVEWREVKGSKGEGQSMRQGAKVSQSSVAYNVFHWHHPLMHFFSVASLSLSSCVMFHSLLFPVVWSGLLVTLYFVIQNLPLRRLQSFCYLCHFIFGSILSFIPPLMSHSFFSSWLNPLTGCSHCHPKGLKYENERHEAKTRIRKKQAVRNL